MKLYEMSELIPFSFYRRCIVRQVFQVCLFGGFRPTSDFFTHLETSPLLVKVYKF